MMICIVFITTYSYHSITFVSTPSLYEGLVAWNSVSAIPGVLSIFYNLVVTKQQSMLNQHLALHRLSTLYQLNWGEWDK